jgi:hypothetical protein
MCPRAVRGLRYSLREVLACFEVAAALGDMPDVEPD